MDWRIQKGRPLAKKHIDIGDDIRPAVREAAEILRNGGVIVFPTETVYGIGVISGNAAALGRLRSLKERDADKPFQYLAADLTMAKSMGAVFSTKAEKLARNYWPGPLTLVVPDGTDGGTLGIRVPDSLFVFALCRELGRPIVSSSANPAGAPPPVTAAAADVFGDAVDLLVDGGGTADGVPSTVVRCRADSFEILRSGGVDDEAIQAAWDE